MFKQILLALYILFTVIAFFALWNKFGVFVSWMFVAGALTWPYYWPEVKKVKPVLLQ